MGLVTLEGNEPRPATLTNGFGTVSLTRDHGGGLQGTQTVDDIGDEDLEEAALHAAIEDADPDCRDPHVEPAPRGADAVADSPTDSGDRLLPVPSDDDWDRKDPVPPLVSDQPARRYLVHPGQGTQVPNIAGLVPPPRPFLCPDRGPKPLYSPAPRPPRADEDDIPVEEERRRDHP